LAESLDIESFLEKSKDYLVIDVRSPIEYQHGHIPHAQNLPLFTDEERAAVGKLYRMRGREEAVKEGLRLIGPKLEQMVHSAEILSPSKTVLIYCWRGGMRSASIAFLLETAGFKVFLLHKGYKSFRQHVIKSFHEAVNLRVLGGMTGSGKTEILSEMKKMGCQTIDLEGLANHKGSAFGHIGQAEQPTTEAFENALFYEIRKLDPQKPAWIEDEGIEIGRVHLPKTFYVQKMNAPILLIEMARELRAERLVVEYSQINDLQLKESIQQIEKKLGNLAMKQALEALGDKDYHSVAMILLVYYDEAYQHMLNKRGKESISQIALHGIDAKINARICLEMMLPWNS